MKNSKSTLVEKCIKKYRNGLNLLANRYLRASGAYEPDDFFQEFTLILNQSTAMDQAKLKLVLEGNSEAKGYFFTAATNRLKSIVEKEKKGLAREEININRRRTRSARTGRMESNETNLDYLLLKMDMELIVHSMPEEHQLVCTLFQAGYKGKDIAKELGKSPPTISNMKKDIYKIIVEELNKNDDFIFKPGIKYYTKK